MESGGADVSAGTKAAAQVLNAALTCERCMLRTHGDRHVAGENRMSLSTLGGDRVVLGRAEHVMNFDEINTSSEEPFHRCHGLLRSSDVFDERGLERQWTVQQRTANIQFGSLIAANSRPDRQRRV